MVKSQKSYHILVWVLHSKSKSTYSCGGNIVLEYFSCMIGTAILWVQICQNCCFPRAATLWFSLPLSSLWLEGFPQFFNQQIPVRVPSKSKIFGINSFCWYHFCSKWQKENCFSPTLLIYHDVLVHLPPPPKTVGWIWFITIQSCKIWEESSSWKAFVLFQDLESCESKYTTNGVRSELSRKDFSRRLVTKGLNTTIKIFISKILQSEVLYSLKPCVCTFCLTICS